MWPPPRFPPPAAAPLRDLPHGAGTAGTRARADKPRREKGAKTRATHNLQKNGVVAKPALPQRRGGARGGRGQQEGWAFPPRTRARRVHGKCINVWDWDCASRDAVWDAAGRSGLFFERGDASSHVCVCVIGRRAPRSGVEEDWMAPKPRHWRPMANGVVCQLQRESCLLSSILLHPLQRWVHLDSARFEKNHRGRGSVLRALWHGDTEFEKFPRCRDELGSPRNEKLPGITEVKINAKMKMNCFFFCCTAGRRRAALGRVVPGAAVARRPPSSKAKRRVKRWCDDVKTRRPERVPR